MTPLPVAPAKTPLPEETLKVPQLRDPQRALDGEPKGVLPVTRECEPARSDHAETACSRRSDEAPNRKPGLDRAESGQLARPAERVLAAGGVLQVRLECVHAWCDRQRARRAGKTSERADRDGEGSQRNAPHARPKLLRIVWRYQESLSLAFGPQRSEAAVLPSQDAAHSPGPACANVTQGSGRVRSSAAKIPGR